MLASSSLQKERKERKERKGKERIPTAAIERLYLYVSCGHHLVGSSFGPFVFEVAKRMRKSLLFAQEGCLIRQQSTTINQSKNSEQSTTLGAFNAHRSSAQRI
jgi:hypothetical protein